MMFYNILRNVNLEDHSYVFGIGGFWLSVYLFGLISETKELNFIKPYIVIV